jgi:hypothetical protein
MPPISGGLKIEAVTDSPPTISYSTTVKAQPYTTVLSYTEPTTPILASGQTIVLTARAQSEFGKPLNKSGMVVCLNEAKFANIGVSDDYSAGIVADRPAGTNTCGYTDSVGEVHFSVTAKTTGSRLLYFQSYGQQGSYGRFGFSSGFVTAAWR